MVFDAVGETERNGTEHTGLDVKQLVHTLEHRVWYCTCTVQYVGMRLVGEIMRDGVIGKLRSTVYMNFVQNITEI